MKCKYNDLGWCGLQKEGWSHSKCNHGAWDCPNRTLLTDEELEEQDRINYSRNPYDLMN
ncbi:MAG: hypothetical protein HN909_00135 [Phycisphaerales bacterium]|jgi:hypothetical protein|nr:hypothetical protein [Phycisphaerales bacterium]MBT7170159.1 hypothetical protein [Phycisphaerales bacterium]